MLSTDFPVMTELDNVMRPELGGYIPLMTLKRVVLPAPLGPMIPVIDPGSSEKPTVFNTFIAPNDILMESTSSSDTSLLLRDLMRSMLPGIPHQ
jgi:hypothetical protein